MITLYQPRFFTIFKYQIILKSTFNVLPRSATVCLRYLDFVVSKFHNKKIEICMHRGQIKSNNSNKMAL